MIRASHNIFFLTSEKDRWTGSLIRDLSDHGASKEPMNPYPEKIHRFLWCTVILMILIGTHIKSVLELIKSWLSFAWWCHQITQWQSRIPASELKWQGNIFSFRWALNKSLDILNCDVIYMFMDRYWRLLGFLGIAEWFRARIIFKKLQIDIELMTKA